MTNNEIIANNIGLISACVMYQFAKVKDEAVKDLREDFLQDLIVTLGDYDNVKMNDAIEHNHFNALITAIIIRNIYSKTSPFYTKYRKFSRQADEITKKLEETYGE